MTTIELPFPPSINHYWRRVGAKTLISKEGRLFREHVGLLLKVGRVKRVEGDLEVTVDLYPPDRRRRDIDNTQKALLDALAHGGAYEDDSQIVKLTIERREVFAGGKCIVGIVRREAS
jgi:crossover junction endodeoxyribonuclease RusA